VIVGDREEELAAALADGMDAALLVVSGGLGPTHDDRTVELVARAAGVGLRLDEELNGEIEGISRRFADRLGRPYVDFEAGVRKQATIPDGALSLGLAGTAPGLVLEAAGAVVVVLPGPPAELRRLWAEALRAGPVRRLLDHARPPELRLLRFFGASDVFLGAVVAYSDDVKVRELDVPLELLNRRGAVSAEAAAAMAAGARARLGSDVAVSVTGIAGPGGGSEEKPVGLVYLHAEGPAGMRSADLVFPGDRDSIRRRAAVTALHLVRRLLTQDRHEDE